MVTMKDIASLAGVSQGSVSNVLNNKGNVSASIIEKVMAAADQLGYRLNTQAQQLRRSSALSNTVAVILPNIFQKRYSLLYSTIEQSLRDCGLDVRLFITENSAYLEEQALKAVQSLRAQAVVSVTSLTEAFPSYKALSDSGARIFFVIRRPNDVSECIDFDTERVGELIGADLRERGFKKIGVLTDEDPCSCYRDLIENIRQNLPAGTEVHIEQSDHYSCFNKVFSLFASMKDPDAIVCVTEDMNEALRSYLSLGLNEHVPFIYSVKSENGALPGVGEAIIRLNVSSMGNRISWLIKDALGIEQKAECPPPLPPVRLERPFVSIPQKNRQINVLIPDNRSTGALRNLAPIFTRKTGIDISFTVLPLAELTSSQVQMPYGDFFDVLRTNVTSMPSYPADALLEIDKASFDDISKTMLNTPRELFPYGISGVPQGIPFDMSMYFQVYRKDLFENALYQRRFYESCGRTLAVPGNYDEENAVLRFFSRTVVPDSPVEFSTTGIINEITTIVYEFFHRYMQTGARFFTDDSEPAFSHDVAVKVLENYLEMMNYAEIVSDFNRKDPGVYNFCAGRTVLEHVSTSISSPLSESMIRGKLGFAELPHILTRIGGGALSIPRSSKHRSEAMAFIEWACSEDMTMPLARLGGHPVHRSLFRHHDIIQQFPWLSLVEDEADRHYEKSDLDRLNRFQFEQLVGGTLRSLFGGLVSVEDAATLIEKNIMACRLK